MAAGARHQVKARTRTPCTLVMAVQKKCNVLISTNNSADSGQVWWQLTAR
jgi:hypothetical protein